MKRKILLPLLIAAAVATVAAALVLRGDKTPPASVSRQPAASHQHAPQQTTSPEPSRVPAHHETTPELSSLTPTLPPEKFTGPTREAYKAVGEIPQTIAQLPCYCHCDEGFGHKSLQSCFVDDHAAHCDICVKEALAAYKLKKQGLTAAQIRERIVAQYAN
jgi:hypothetical protein